MMTSKYHPKISAYMDMVKNQYIESCESQKQLVYFLEKKLNEPGVIIDNKSIDEAIENIEKHFSFKLLPWEEFILCFVVGVYAPDGYLMFDEFFIMMGRGGGKTGFMSVLEWWMISKQNIPKYHVDIVATSEDQAKESFTEIHDILSSNEKKYRRYFRWTLEKISFRKTNSVLRYRTSNPKTKDGGRPGAIIFDEIHAMENEDNIKVFTSGLGKKRNPRRFYFTTDGYLRGGFLDQLKEESKWILEGERPLRRTFPFICKLDNLEEYKDKSKWEKANPSLRYFPSLFREMEGEYEKLEDRASARIEFLTKRMNMPLDDSYEGVTSWENIKSTNQSYPDLSGKTCVGAIDYSDTDDFCAVGLLFKVGTKYYLKHHTFIHEKSLKNRVYKVPLDVAQNVGLVTIVKDRATIEPEILIDWFLEQSKKYNIKEIASDLYRINFLRDSFRKAGFNNLSIARTGVKTHTELQPVVESIFANNNIVYCDDDFMMRWYTRNIYVKRNKKNNNIMYEKIEPKLRKTDGFSMFLHALQLREILDNEKIVTYNRRLRTYTY